MAPNLAGGSASDEREQINDSLTVALEAAQPYAKEGFVIREDYWGGTLQQSAKAIQHQLFKGNEYWFWIGSDVPSARVSVHIYDSKGDLAESEDWQRKNTGAAHVIPARTGTYYIIVSDQVPNSQNPPRRPRVVPWAMAYGFR